MWGFSLRMAGNSMERRLAKTNSAQNLRAIHSLDRLIHRVVFFQFNADLHDCWLIHSDVSGQPKKKSVSRVIRQLYDK